MNTTKAILLLNSAVVAGYVLWKYRQYRNAIKKIQEEEHNNKTAINIALFFSPPKPGDCDKHINHIKCDLQKCRYRKIRFILDCLNSCRKSLDVCIHLLTSADIATCIIDAHNRGVNVRVICDNEMSSNKGSQIRRIINAGICVRIPTLKNRVHSKMAIIDGWKVLNGSMNWTAQAMSGNWENVVITSNVDIVKQSVMTFNLMWGNSTQRC